MHGLAQVGVWVDEVTAALGLPPNAEYALRLCTEEAVANVVMHGEAAHEGNVAHVALHLQADPELLRVTIEDDCAEFDPLNVPVPAQLARLEDARVGGLGIHLMRQYARTMEYQRLEGINRLTLTIALHGAK